MSQPKIGLCLEEHITSKKYVDPLTFYSYTELTVSIGNHSTVYKWDRLRNTKEEAIGNIFKYYLGMVFINDSRTFDLIFTTHL